MNVTQAEIDAILSTVRKTLAVKQYAVLERELGLGAVVRRHSALGRHAAGSMTHLSDHDLKQMDDAWLDGLPDPVSRGLLKRTVKDLRAARDQLNQTPLNSSRPSGSMPPWQRGAATAGEGAPDNEELVLEQDVADHSADKPPEDVAGVARHAQAAQSADQTRAEAQGVPAVPPRAQSKVPGRPGRRVGAPGHGREQKLAPSHTHEHRPACCAACLLPLPSDDPARAWTGWDTLELVALGESGDAAPIELGARIEVTRHLLMQQLCACGHTTQAQAVRAPDDPLWPGVDISQQRLLGPRLAATLVYLCLRMRLPRRKVSELMLELFGLQVSPALIDQTVHQAARSVAPLEEQLAQQLEQAVLLHADETSWAESGQALWLWVLCCCHTVLYVIGERTKEMFDNALSTAFAGTLMSDGYGAYRRRELRLRCWAHLHRKLRGLSESTDRQGAQAGTAMLQVFDSLMAAIFEARARLAQPPPADSCAAMPAVTHADLVQRLRQLCVEHRDASHKVLRDVAREFLNDWDVIVRPLADPRLPLTNNAAERQLRHYVIARRVSYGTRNEVGSHSMALLASVIDTCRLRRASVTNVLANAIHAARMGTPVPVLPPIPADLLRPELSPPGL